MYGPTETTIWSSCYKFGDSVPVSSSGVVTVPVGTPISQVRGHPTSMYLWVMLIGSTGAQTDFFLVDPDWTGPGLRLVEAEGELLIGGVGVARGYLNAPDLTEKVDSSPCKCTCTTCCSVCNNLFQRACAAVSTQSVRNTGNGV